MSGNGRSARIERRTTETQIELELCLDGRGQCRAETGVGFFDHMLNAFARHGLFDLEVNCQGDLEIDAHHTVEEIWYFLAGQGELWRKQNGRSEIVDVKPGTAITIPVGTHFQFRSHGPEPLAAVAITMPPWPGEGEAYEVEGTWRSGSR